MLSTQEREHKKGKFSKRSADNVKKYDELFANNFA